MNLNMSIIATELSDLQPRAHIRGSVHLDLSEYLIYDSQPMRDSALYLLNAKSFTREMAGMSSGHFVVCGPVKEDFVEPLSCEAIFLPREEDLSALLQRVLTIHQEYSTWNERLLRYFAIRKPLKEILDHMNRKIQASIVLCNLSFDVLACSGPIVDEAGYQTTTAFGEDAVSLVRKGKYPRELFYSKASFWDTSNRALQKSRRSTLKGGCKHCGFIILRNEHDPCGFLEVMSGSERLSPGQLSLIDHIRPIWCSIAEAYDSFDLLEASHGCFQLMIEGRHVSESDLNAALASLRWSRQDEYQVICFYWPSRFRPSTTSFRLFVERARRAYPCSELFLSSEHVIVLSRTKDLATRPLTKELLGKLDPPEGTCVGLSIPFYDIRDLTIACQQGIYAVDELIELIEKEAAAPFLKKRDLPVRHFSKDYFGYFLAKAGMQPDANGLLHPKVRKLCQYDRKRGSNLLKCLTVYLECCCSQAKASQKLSVHRNTLVYKLQQIKEVADIDVDAMIRDGDLFPILFSCKYLLASSSSNEDDE